MIYDMITYNSIDICAITETWLTGDHRDHHSLVRLMDIVPSCIHHLLPHQIKTARTETEFKSLLKNYVCLIAFYCKAKAHWDFCVMRYIRTVLLLLLYVGIKYMYIGSEHALRIHVHVHVDAVQ